MKNIPILYVWPTGIGKTQKVRQEFGYTEVLLLSSLTEEDVAGIPYHEKGKEKRTIPPFVQRLQEAVQKGKSTCLFLDELDKARREVADTCLSLVTDQTMFGIPETVEIRAAANPPERWGGDGISIPMLNRFAVMHVDVDIQNSTEYLRKKYPHVDKKLFDEFEDGTIPMLDIKGEGLNTLITSPRSIEMAIVASLSSKPELVDWLVTPVVARHIKNFFSNTNKEDEKVYNKAYKTYKSSLSRKPLRLWE